MLCRMNGVAIGETQRTYKTSLRLWNAFEEQPSPLLFMILFGFLGTESRDDEYFRVFGGS